MFLLDLITYKRLSNFRFYFRNYPYTRQIPSQIIVQEIPVNTAFFFLATYCWHIPVPEILIIVTNLSAISYNSVAFEKKRVVRGSMKLFP